MSNFRVGQKVVCVDDRTVFKSFWPLRKGDVYTIAKVEVQGGISAIDRTRTPALCLVLVEIPGVRTVTGPDPDCGYEARRFRPVVERKTDISIFTTMLHKLEKDAQNSTYRKTAKEPT